MRMMATPIQSMMTLIPIVILKKRCQMIRMMMDIMDTVDIMNMVNVIEGDGRYERKVSPMMSPIISPVTA